MAKKKNKSPPTDDAEYSIAPSMPSAPETSKPKVKTPPPPQSQPSTSALIICRNKYVPGASRSLLALFRRWIWLCCVDDCARRILMLPVMGFNNLLGTGVISPPSTAHGFNYPRKSLRTSQIITTTYPVHALSTQLSFSTY